MDDNLSDERSSFIEAIQSDPNDNLARLVFADWLEEQGDSQGELIRLQLQIEELRESLAATPDFVEVKREIAELQQREREVLDDFHRRTRDPLKQLGAHGVTIRRGFVDELIIDAERFVEFADEILLYSPGLRVLNLRHANEHIAAVISTPQLERIRSLDVRLAGLSRTAILELVTAPSLRKLEELNLHGNGFGAFGCESLASATFEALRVLNIGGNRIGPTCLRQLIAAPVFSRLERLILWGNPIGRQGCALLADWEGLRNIKYLDVARTSPGIRGRSSVHLIQRSKYLSVDAQLFGV